MLRIFTVDRPTRTPGVARIRLVGRVSGLWVAELRRLSANLLGGGDRLEIDMADVSFVDADGLRLFEELTGPRVVLVGCALFVAEQLKTLQQDVCHERCRR